MEKDEGALKFEATGRFANGQRPLQRSCRCNAECSDECKVSVNRVAVLRDVNDLVVKMARAFAGVRKADHPTPTTKPRDQRASEQALKVEDAIHPRGRA